MITELTRTGPAKLTTEDVGTWARIHLRDDPLWAVLRRHSRTQDSCDAEAMFSATDAADEPDPPP